MFKKNVLTILCITAFLLACPAVFQTRANSAAQDYEPPHRQLAPTAVQLQPVLGGLTFTVYVAHAHDGTNRLFIIEKVGRILVAQPGASTTTVFLDISSRVLSTQNERGLLGLAFHPQYSINGRFFVGCHCVASSGNRPRSDVSGVAMRPDRRFCWSAMTCR